MGRVPQGHAARVPHPAEAELNGGRLKGVGGRIVAETIHRAIEGSEHSTVHDTAFKPTLGPNNTTFRMVDLRLFAFQGRRPCWHRSGSSDRQPEGGGRPGGRRE